MTQSKYINVLGRAWVRSPRTGLGGVGGGWLVGVWALVTLAAAGWAGAQDEVPGSQAPDKPIRAVVVGQTRLWTVRQPVAETNRDEVFQTERYGPAFAYVFTNVPPGPCTVKLGFCENKWTRPGERVFDIAINGRVVWPAFDILRHGMPNEAVVVAHTVQVPETGSLEISFRAREDNAKINLIRLCGVGWVAETSPKDEDRAMFLKPDPEAAWMLDVYETCLGRFGSRLAINPRPQEGVFVAGPLGHADFNVAYFEDEPERFADAKVNYYFVVEAEGRQRGLPFNPNVPVFPRIKQRQGMTWLEYEAGSPDLPVEAVFRFEAPFCPQDLKASCAPYMNVKVRLRNLTGRRLEARVVLGREQRPEDEVGGVSMGGWRGLSFAAPVFRIPTRWYWLVPRKLDQGQAAVSVDISSVRRNVPEDSFSTDSEGRTVVPIIWDRPIAGVQATVSLKPFGTAVVPMVWVAWVDRPVVEVLGRPHRFVYTRLFKRAEDVVNFAVARGAACRKAAEVFESTVRDATLPQSLKELLAFAFQSWVVNTWYLADEAGKEWFSVWEGCCKFHSTVDVEYNVAPLYLQYWPELLRMELLEWSGRITDGVLPHDMGMGLEANGMRYGHHMEVEENTNFVLLLHQYWKYTGDMALVRSLLGKVEELLGFVTRCDTDGDGFVEEGTSNTIDQGSEAVQHAPDQVYLAVRALAAYRAGAEMALVAGREELAGPWRERAALIARTLERDGWLGDHYAVDLNQSQAEQVATSSPAGGLAGAADAGGEGRGQARDPAGLEPPGAEGGGEVGYGEARWGEMGPGGQWAPPPATLGQVVPEGWDAYSLYTTNGLLYPFRAGMRLEELNVERLRMDLRRAAAETLGVYGSPHTSRERNMWVSQNMWRDAAAAYLGVDMIDNVDRYWALQLHINRKKRGCFTDVYNYGSGSISLDYYPRGVAAFALVYALGGVAIDVPAGRVSVMALRSPLRIPLTTLADWKKGTVPWLVMERTGPDTRARIEGPTRVPVRLVVRGFGEPW